MLEDRDIILLAALIFAVAYLASGKEAKGETLRDYIFKIARENNIDPALIMGIIQVESNWNPNAVRVEPNGYKSIGLMQVTIQAARDAGYMGDERGLFNPKINIKYGVKYLRKMLDIFNGNIYKAIAAYNAGPGNVKRGRFSFTYVNKVMREYNKFKRIV